MDRRGDSETSGLGILNGRRMRSLLPWSDRRTMHPGKRMLTVTITRFAVEIDRSSRLLTEDDRLVAPFD